MCVMGVEVRKITHPFPRKVFLIIFFPFLIKLDLLAHFEAQSPSHLEMGEKAAYNYRQNRDNLLARTFVQNQNKCFIRSEFDIEWSNFFTRCLTNVQWNSSYIMAPRLKLHSTFAFTMPNKLQYQRHLRTAIQNLKR